MAQVTDTLETLTAGSKVWLLSDDGSWLDGVLRSKGDSTCEVELPNGKRADFPVAKVQPANPSFLDGSSDLCQLSYLNEPSVLHDLAFRFTDDKIYTFAGPVLIAMNPCKALPLYTGEVAARYSGVGRKDLQYASGLTTSSSEPHIFLVAAQAFSAMVRENGSQSLVVSGESGAGKTETTKRAMQYFANLAGGNGIEDRVMETNPILEAFGNAKTTRNHNSSRFGKLIEIFFNHTHHICGAGIRTYLLEKSRVVNQLPEERSYHIFYQLVAGASPEERVRYRLPESAEDFVYLSKSGCTVIPSIDDVQEFKDFKKASLTVGLTEAQLDNLLALVSGVMWLGNLTFAASGDDSSTVVPGPALDSVCAMLGVTPEGLNKALTKREVKVGKDVIEANNTATAAAEARDALAKAIYSALFDWLVAQINAKLSAGKRGAGLAIAILDIFGFEDFKTNSFEQLCINFTNERLQMLFNKHIFTLQQQEYEAEGVGNVEIKFEDNTPTVDLIDARPPQGLGVLCLMDGQCRMPKATDESLMNDVKNIKVSPNRITFNPRNKAEFAVEHFAGKVTYNVTGMLEKNKDTVGADLVDLMAASGQALLKELGAVLAAERAAAAGAAGGGGRAATLGLRFSNSLKELMAALEGTGLHFVRCIKPNPRLAPNTFEQPMVLNQLRCCGVLEVVKMAKAGYPSRMVIESFVNRYQVLLPDMQGKQDNETYIQAATRLLKTFGIAPEQYLVGRSKIFFKPGVVGVIDDKWALYMRLAQVVQSSIRCWHWRTWFQKERRAAIAVQTAIRSRAARRGYIELALQDRAARKVQKAWRSVRMRRTLRAIKKAAVMLQMFARRWAFRRRVRRRRHEREKKELLDRLAAEEAERVAALAKAADTLSVEGVQPSAEDIQNVVKAFHAMTTGGVQALEDLANAKGMMEQEGSLPRNSEEMKELETKVKLQGVLQRVTLQINNTLRSKFRDAAAVKPDEALQQALKDKDRVIKEKEQRIHELERKVADLEARAGQDSKVLPPTKTAEDLKRERADELQEQVKRSAAGQVAVLEQDMEAATSVMDDNVAFLEEVGFTPEQPQGLDPFSELSKLTGVFTIWKRDFKEKLAKCRELLSKRVGRTSVRDITSRFGGISSKFGGK